MLVFSLSRLGCLSLDSQGFFVACRCLQAFFLKELRCNMSMSRSRSFHQDGFTYVIPRTGFIYKILGEHAHEEVISLVKAGKIPLAYLKTKMPAGNHRCREHIVNAFEDKEAVCHS